MPPLCLAPSAAFHMTSDRKRLAPVLSHPATKRIFVLCCVILVKPLAH